MEFVGPVVLWCCGPFCNGVLNLSALSSLSATFFFRRPFIVHYWMPFNVGDVLSQSRSCSRHSQWVGTYCPRIDLTVLSHRDSCHGPNCLAQIETISLLCRTRNLLENCRVDKCTIWIRTALKICCFNTARKHRNIGSYNALNKHKNNTCPKKSKFNIM